MHSSSSFSSVSNQLPKKCIIVGNRGSGKTSFMQAFSTREYGVKEAWESYVPTHGANVGTFTEGPTKFNLWDISGLCDFRDWEFKGYMLGVTHAIIIDDGTKYSHGKNWSIRRWRAFIRKSLEEKGVNSKIPIVVVKMKQDDAVSGEVSQDGVISVSAKNRINLALPFRILSNM
jgi:GTPase SAR1 family protein